VGPPGRSYPFVRFAQYGNIGSSVAAFTNFAWTFRLNDVPNVSEFTSLFDQYRIKKVTLMLIPNQTESIPSAANFGLMFRVIDYDDANLLTANTDYMQYQNCQLHPVVFPGIMEIPVVPRIASAVYGGGAFTSYGNTEMWLDVASPSVEHYGVKLGISQTTVSVAFQVVAKFELEFRNPR